MGNVTGKRGQWAYVKGAMGAVSQAIANSARRFGAEILTEAEVAQVAKALGYEHRIERLQAGAPPLCGPPPSIADVAALLKARSA